MSTCPHRKAKYILLPRIDFISYGSGKPSPVHDALDFRRDGYKNDPNSLSLRNKPTNGGRESGVGPHGGPEGSRGSYINKYTWVSLGDFRQKSRRRLVKSC